MTNLLAVTLWLGAATIGPGLGFAAGLATTGQHTDAALVVLAVVIALLFGLGLFAGLASRSRVRGGVRV